MRITLNLSPMASRRDRYALAWAVPATLIGLAVLVLLGRASLHEYRDYRGIQKQVAEVQSRTEELSNQEADIRRKLADPAYRELLRKARFVNKLIDERELSLTKLSARLAGLLPEDARLTSLALVSPKKQGDDNSVRIAITAKNEDAFETFLNDLEDAPDFKDVSITNQGFQEESAQGQQVSIVCTARYLPEAEEEVENRSQEPEAGSQKSEAANQAAGAEGQKAGGKTSNPEAASQKSEVVSQAAGAKGQKAGGKTPEPKAGSQMPEKGAMHSRAQEPTPNRKPGH